MPSSPLDSSQIEKVKDAEHAFRRGLRELDHLLDSGIGLSGRERNCAFLNIPGKIEGGRRFATVSAVTGIDFDDDSRAPALVDWDQDGDLDVWMANRTAPMLRFLRNDSPLGTNWVAFRLCGVKCNRDAIGAAVVIELDDGQRLRRTLKAGEGYLGQSSKWLHFGTGSASAIRSLTVYWPGGAAEQISGANLGGRFEIVEGSGKAVPEMVKPVKLANARPESIPESGAVHTLTASRLPLPTLPYRAFDGKDKVAGGASTGLVLVNLWATWCAPCIAELKAFASGNPELRRAGVRVVALSVDGLVDEDEESSGDPATFYRQLRLPFDGGMATAELVARLETAYAQLFSLHWPLPVPTSVLLDEGGAIIAFYRGTVDVKRIIRDVILRKSSADEFHAAALPFTGKWFKRPKPLDPLAIPLALMERGQVSAAAELAARARAHYTESREFAKLLTWIGDEQMKAGRVKEALDHYTRALQMDDQNVIVLNNLAWQLAAHPDPAVRDGAKAVRWAEKAATLTSHQDAAVLDTLAAAYAQAGRFREAVSTAEKALKMATHAKAFSLANGIRKALQKYRSGSAY